MKAILAVLLLTQTPPSEARISLDLKDAEVVDIVRLLSDVGGFQVVFDPGVSCKLTLKLNQVRWRTALDRSLEVCGLGVSAENDVLRIAPMSRLRDELAASRKLDEEKSLSAARRLLVFHLSYARAREMAPLVKRLLSPRGDVVFDERTNTLIVTE